MRTPRAAGASRQPFLDRLKGLSLTVPPPGLTLGGAPSHDPGELVVKATGNRLEAPANARGQGSLIVHAAEYNSHKLLNRKFSLPGETGAEKAPTRSGAVRTPSGDARR